MLEIISMYLESGLSIIPTHPKHKNPKVKSWTSFQKDKPTKEQIQKWFKNGSSSPGIITGKVSGNIELFDFDEKARQFRLWKDLVDEQSPGLVDSFPQQTTQNGGIHVVYRCSEETIPGAKKLSMGAIVVDGPGEHQHDGKRYKALQYRGKWIITPTLIETRGEGGYFLAYPGKGYSVVKGDFTKIPNISPKNRQILFSCAEILTEYTRETELKPPPIQNIGDSPGDSYNSNVTIQSIIKQDGWKYSGRDKSLPDGTAAEMWTRPGKKVGVSATVYDNKIYIFTSNATPLEDRVSYSPFAYHAVINHSGNYRNAALDLIKQGYGDKTSKQGKHSKQNTPKESDSMPRVSERQENHHPDTPLSFLINEYVEEYTGTFSVWDIDREFALVSRSEKNNRSKILNNLAVELKIKRIPGKTGVWKTIDGKIKPMRLGQLAIKPLEITLPLGLSELAQILPGNIILVAGSPNGGKTAFLLTSLYTLLKNFKKLTTKEQLNGDYRPSDKKGVAVEDLITNGIRYLNSEMDENELTDRCSSFDDGLEIFSSNVDFIQRYRDFADVIIPNGINFIDFLEIHEDFFELGKLINEIFENLKNGICFIACQKKQGADYAKGGAASLEKPRLVVNLDRNEGHGKICKIVKCKKPVNKGDNHDGKEVDFDIDGYTKFNRYSTWRYVNEKQRRMYNNDYETQGLNIIPEKEYAFVFRLKDGSQGRVLVHQVDRWQKSFPVIDVEKELLRIEHDSIKKPFLGPGWFHMIPNMLGKVKLIR